MRFAFALIATTLLACSSPGSDDPEGSGDEAAVVAVAAPQVIDAVETSAGRIVDWKVGADGRAWRANGRYFGLAGAKPLFDSGQDFARIESWSLDAGTATLYLTSSPRSIVQVNLSTGAATKLVPQISQPLNLTGPGIASDATGVYFVGRPGADQGSSGDLWRVDRNGKLTRLANDFFVMPENDNCDLIMMPDASSLFAVQACHSGSQILQVPLAGGSVRIVAGVADHVQSAALVGDSIVYATNAEVSRIPKTGGAKTLALRAYLGTVAADGTELLLAEHPVADKVAVSRSRPGGGAPISLGEIPALTPKFDVTARSLAPTKDAVFVTVVETTRGDEGWKYRLVKLPR